MKRPLFWAVISFALGEVAYLYTGRMIGMGMVFAVSVCCVVLFGRKHAYASYLSICVICMLFGIANISYRQKPPEIYGMLENGYSASMCFREESYDVLTYGGELRDSLAITGYGRVVDVKSVKKSGLESNVIVGMCYTDTAGGGFFEEYRIMLYGVSERLEPGMWISVRGTVRAYGGAANPGGFDMYSYYRAKGIYLYMNNAEIIGDISEELCGTKKSMLMKVYWRYRRYLWKLGTNFNNQFHLFADAHTADMYSGILLGDRSGIDDSLKRLYRINGIAHILAISGLHISIIGGLMYRLLRRLGLPFYIAGIAAIFMIVSYGSLTGFESATLRAVIMLCMYITGEILGRSYDMLTGMAAALFIMLINNPYCITDGGTVLSFAAMFGVVLGLHVISRMNLRKRLKKWKRRHKWMSALFSNFLLALSVNLITAPVIIRLYYELPVYSLFINMLVIPLMSIVVISGLASLAVSYFSLSIAGLVIIPGEKILMLYESICRKAMLLPYNTINVGHVDILVIVIYYAAVCLILMSGTKKFGQIIRTAVYKYRHIWLDYKRWRVISIILKLGILFSGAAVCGALYFNGRREMIVLLDVGQGDGIIIRSDKGTGVVIDGGSADDDSLGEYTLIPALKYMGMSEIDYWLVTHTDSDHISGLIYILEEKQLTGIKIKNLIVSKYSVRDERLKELIALASEQDITVITMDVSDYVADDTFNITCCHPDESYAADDKNDASLALRYCSDSYNMLFLGDMGTAAEEHMLAVDSDILRTDYDAVKIAHHGSRYSICEKLYDAACGGYAVISCGSGNSYGHPHEETIQALEAAGAVILRTDKMGAIMFIAR